MKNIKINNSIQNINIKKIEEKTIKWFMSELIEKYSSESIEKSINKIKKEITI